MISNLVIIICLLEFGSVLAINSELIQKEENLLYSHLKTQTNLSLFYQKLLKSNDIDDITRIQRIITQNDIQQFNLEHKVNNQILDE
jgi:ABC-type thiamine transport system ATPase subunit